MHEVWRPVVGFEQSHVVSNVGRVRSLPRLYDGVTPSGDHCQFRVAEKLLSQRISNTGYTRVSLCVDGVIKAFSVHRLLAIAFIPNPDNLPQVNHIDGDRLNNVDVNIEWCTPSGNQLHALAMGLANPAFGIDHGHAKLNPDKVRNIRSQIANGISYRSISKAFGIAPSQITRIKQGSTWKHVE